VDKEVNARDIRINGIRTRIDEAGEGPPLLLVHGLGGPLMWQRVIEPLSNNFLVVSVHLPGFGESDCTPTPLTTEQYAGFLCNLLDTLSIQSCILVGISYGGQIATTFAGRFPERVGKLILIASTGLKDHSILRKKFVWKIVAGCVKYIVLRSEWLICFVGRFSFYDSQNRPEDLCRNFHEQISGKGKADAWLNALWNVVAEPTDFRQTLRSLRVRTLILWGKQDRILDPRLTEEFQHLIPNSVIRMLEECGHSAPLEKAEEVCGELKSFS